MTVRHKLTKTITEYAIVPEHATRKESDRFENNREILIQRVGKCYICDGTENLQAHHYGCEWSFWNDCDHIKLQKYLLDFDIYGFSQFYRSRTIDSPDDIRNLMLLCEKHHIEKERGIHEMTFPMWIMQKIVNDRSDLFKS